MENKVGRAVNVQDAKNELKNSIRKLLLQSVASAAASTVPAVQQQMMRRSRSASTTFDYPPAFAPPSTSAVLHRSSAIDAWMPTTDDRKRGVLVRKGGVGEQPLISAAGSYVSGEMVPVSGGNNSIAQQNGGGRFRAEWEDLALRLWEKLDEKYTEKTVELLGDLEKEQKKDISRTKRQLRKQLATEQAVINSRYLKQLNKLKLRERDLWKNVQAISRLQQHELAEQREELQLRIQEADDVRAQLQHAEDEFFREQQHERTRLRRTRERLRQSERQARQRERDSERRLAADVTVARLREREFWSEKYRELTKREEKLAACLKKLRTNATDLTSLQQSAEEKDLLVQDLKTKLSLVEDELGKTKERLFDANQKLKEQIDYPLLKFENNDYLSQVSQMNTSFSEQKSSWLKEKQALLDELHSLRDRLLMAEKLNQEKILKNEEVNIDGIQSKNDSKGSFSKINDRIAFQEQQMHEIRHQLSTVVKILGGQRQQLRNSSSNKFDSQKFGDNNNNAAFSSGYGGSQSVLEADYSSSESNTPIYVREARDRLRSVNEQVERWQETMRETSRRISNEAVDQLCELMTPPMSTVPPITQKMSEFRSTQGNPNNFTSTKLEVADNSSQFDRVALNMTTAAFPPNFLSNYSRPPQPFTSLAESSRQIESSSSHKIPSFGGTSTKLGHSQHPNIMEVKKKADTTVLIETNANVGQQVVGEAEGGGGGSNKIDPVMQQYMQMVLERRKQEAENSKQSTSTIVNKNGVEISTAVEQPDRTVKNIKPDAVEQEIEIGGIAAVGGDAANDFEW